MSSDVSFVSQGTAGRESSGRSKLDYIPEGTERAKQKRKRFRPASSLPSSSDAGATRPPIQVRRSRKVGTGRKGSRGAEIQLPQPETRDTLVTAALRNVAVIQDQVKKSGHIKGTTWRAINDATKGVIEAVEGLRTITPGEEHRRLRADNDRLAKELDIVRAELRAFKKAFEESRAAPAKAPEAQSTADLKEVLDELRRDLRVSLGGMINARLGDLEARLPPEPVLRHPLAADRQQKPPARPRAQPNLVAGTMREPPQA